MQKTYTKVYDFLGYDSLGTYSSPWRARATGTPTTPAVVDGALKLALPATNEIEVSGAYFGDILPFKLADIQALRIWAKFLKGSGSTVSALFGLVGAASDTLASMDGIYWAVSTAGVVTLSVHDGVAADVDSIATGVTLATTLKCFELDFRSGIRVRDPRDGGSEGGSACILANVTNAAGNMAPVARETVMDLSALTSRLQLIAQIAKTSSSDTGYLSIARIELDLKLNLSSF